MLKGRDIIIYLAVKYKGDWNSIYQAIKTKEIVEEPDVRQAMDRLQCSVVTIIDDTYPEALKKIYKPPFVLFYYGNLNLAQLTDQSLAVIGSRLPSSYGLEMTKVITQQLNEEGMIIVSGLAKGVDTMAHQTVIDHGGKTIAILGSGIDHCYPKENLSLYESIKAHHLLISEYPHHTSPDKQNFPWRNRLIAGLSSGVFVAEAKQKSGTLITVGYALYLGKDVYVLPHHANTDNSTNQLIKDGALLVESGQDILEQMHGKKELKNHEPIEKSMPEKFI
jgi:DNA processing protein